MLHVRSLHAVEAGTDDVLTAQGELFVTPENLASMAGLMKVFFDHCYDPVLDRVQSRSYAVMVCAGSNGSHAVRQIECIAAGWRLKAVAQGLARCENLGAVLATGLALGVR